MESEFHGPQYSVSFMEVAEGTMKMSGHMELPSEFYARLMVLEVPWKFHGA